ncbi:MAG: mannitol dehydrogenase family protein, partial [Mesorhizobium sp.]
HPDIVADAQPGATPKTVFGIILAGLMRRRDEGVVPFTIMSCDNIPHNGHVTADGVIGLARLIDEKLANWVSANVAFPNGMVDRIT